MKATHTIKRNGKWYNVGQEVPEDKQGASFAYTKTDINRMSTADLQALASENGIVDADSFSGADLKSMLMEKFDLQGVAVWN